MAYRPHGHAQVNPESPSCWATCARCGFNFNLKNLNWQYDWRGNALVNLQLLVCDKCLDTPSPWYRSIVLPPDPPPVINARPEPYAVDEAGGYAPTTLSWGGLSQLFTWNGIQIVWQ